MTFQNLLVHLDDTKSCAYRVEAAIALAKRQDAHLTGIAVAIKSTVSNYMGFEIPSSLSEQQQDKIQEAAEACVDNFQKLATEAGINHSTEIIQNILSIAIKNELLRDLLSTHVILT